MIFFTVKRRIFYGKVFIFYSETLFFIISIVIFAGRFGS